MYLSSTINSFLIKSTMSFLITRSACLWPKTVTTSAYKVRLVSICSLSFRAPTNDRIVIQCNFFQWIIYWAPIAVDETFQSSLSANHYQIIIFTNITLYGILLFILSIVRADNATFFLLLISALIFWFLFVNQPQFVKMAIERNQFVSSHIVDSILALIKVN